MITNENVQLWSKAAQVLIFDQSVAAQFSIRTLLLEMQFAASNIKIATTIEEAKRAIQLFHPQMILSEYQVGTDLGLNLIEDTHDSLFVMVTGNSSQSAIAKAAELEVDDFILKPFSADAFKTRLTAAIQNRFFAEGAMQAYRTGVELVQKNELELALQSFKEAKSVGKGMALASYQIAKVLEVTGKDEAASKELEDALARNGVYFKGLEALYQKLMSNKKRAEAYPVLRSLILQYPENPERLSQGIRMSVELKELRDLEVFFQIYGSLIERTESVKNHLSSALSVYGKHELTRSKRREALAIFEKALRVAGQAQKVVHYIEDQLSDVGLAAEFEPLLTRAKHE